MSRIYTAQDGCAIMTALLRQATGQQNITVTDLNTFISAGQTVLSTGRENVYNAFSIVMGRTLVAARVYMSRLRLMNALNSGTFTHRLRKESFYSRDPKPAGNFNTDLYTNLAQGFTNGQNPDANGDPQSTKSQYEQCQAMPCEFEFGGSTAWQHGITIYDYQIDQAFRGPEEMAAVTAGIMTEHGNDIESVREAFNEMVLINQIAATYLYEKGAGWTTGQVVNLTSKYNAEYGTNYTSAQLRSTYLKSFLEFMTAEIKAQIDYLKERTAAHHLPMTKTVGGVSYSILRHTPLDRQRLYLYQPLFRKAESMVLPEIFNADRLDLNTQYEGVNYWQSNTTEADRPKIKCRCAFYDKTTGQQASSGDIALDYVVGLLCDEDAMMTDFQLERADTSPYEARKHYRTTWLSIAKNGINDPTENSVIFIMDDSDLQPEPGPEAGNQESTQEIKKKTVKK